MRHFPSMYTMKSTTIMNLIGGTFFYRIRFVSTKLDNSYDLHIVGLKEGTSDFDDETSSKLTDVTKAFTTSVGRRGSWLRIR